MGDQNGMLIYHPNFGTGGKIEENIFISELQAEIATDMVNRGILEREGCVDYAAGSLRLMYVVHLPESGTQQINMDSTGCSGTPRYSISAIPRTNSYLVA